MSAVTVITFDLAFVFERWLRHTGKLAPNTSIWQKIYSGIAIVGAIVGGVGLILLSIFDTVRHPRLHNVFLAVFIIGYIVSAIFICWEYQRLGIHFRQHSVLRISFWIKLNFILIELALAIAFGVLGNQHHWNTAAVLEWVIAFFFFFYVASFFIDFMPVLRSRHHQSRQTEMEMARGGDMGDGAANPERYYRGPTNGHVDGYANTNGYANGYSNGNANAYKPAEPAPLASRNF